MKAAARIMSAGSGLIMLVMAGSSPLAAQTASGLSGRFAIEEQRRSQIQRPAPEGEAALRRFIAAVQAGTPDYGAMSPGLADWVRANAPLVEVAKGIGSVQSVRFRAVGPVDMVQRYQRQRCPQGCAGAASPVSVADIYLVSGEKGTASWMVALAADGKIDWMLAFPADVPPANPLPLGQATESVRTTLAEQVAADKFSGALLMRRNGREIFSYAGGLADREARTPVKADTRFRIGSMNKMFTAVSILQLAEAGKVDLDAPFGRYLPGYPNQDLANSVTLHHLLTHSGGAGDIFGPEFNAKRLSLRTHQDYVDLYGARAATGAPGATWAYANYGFILLGRVVERVSGLSYYDYVDSHIFKPAGMTRSGSLPEEEKVEGRATGYWTKDGKLVSAAETLPWRGTAAGGGYSTVGDLVRFGEALLAGKLLSPLGFKILTGGKFRLGDAFYAYGFFDADDPTGHYVGHGGGAPGMNGDLRIYPETGVVIAALANLDPPAAGNALDAVANQILPALAATPAR